MNPITLKSTDENANLPDSCQVLRGPPAPCDESLMVRPMEVRLNSPTRSCSELASVPGKAPFTNVAHSWHSMPLQGQESARANE